MAEKTEYSKAPEELEFDFIYTRLYEYWKNIALSVIHWKGLEQASEALNSTIVEEQLFEKGLSAFFSDENYGFLCLKASNGYGKNIYGKAQNYNVFGENGEFNKTINADDCVIIKNNNLATPTAKMLQFYCTKLAEIEMTKQLNLNANKMPIMFETSEDTLLSNKNIFKQIRSFSPAIFKNKMAKMDGGELVKILNADAPYILDKLEDEYNCYVAKILTLLGLDNFIEDKAERVQSAEVEANQEYIIMSFKTMLDQRKEACEKINKKYGLNLSVEYVLGEQIEPEQETTKDESEANNE